MDFLNHTPAWLDRITGIALLIALIVTGWRSSRAFSEQHGRTALLQRTAGIVITFLGITLVVIGLSWWPSENTRPRTGAPIVLVGVLILGGGVSLLHRRA